MEKSGFNEIMNKNFFLIVIIIILIVILIYCFFIGFNQNNALIIAKEPFNSTQNNNCKLYKIVLHYAHWCGYCKKLLPEWEKFVQYVSDQNVKNLIIEKIDCDKNKQQCSQIPGYPTIILYDENGNQKIMNGDYERNLQGLLKFVNDNAQ